MDTMTLLHTIPPNVGSLHLALSSCILAALISQPVPADPGVPQLSPELIEKELSGFSSKDLYHLTVAESLYLSLSLSLSLSIPLSLFLFLSFCLYLFLSFYFFHSCPLSTTDPRPVVDKMNEIGSDSFRKGVFQIKKLRVCPHQIRKNHV